LEFLTIVLLIVEPDDPESTKPMCTVYFFDFAVSGIAISISELFSLIYLSADEGSGLFLTI
jgi:hypothetical protein